jgi:predicted branched-subunit amino acid permease
VDKNDKLQIIQRKTRQRLIFAGISLCFYFSYVLNYTSGSSLGDRLGTSHVTGSLLMFVLLILSFIGLELLFLAINRSDKGE